MAIQFYSVNILIFKNIQTVITFLSIVQKMHLLYGLMACLRIFIVVVFQFRNRVLAEL